MIPFVVKLTENVFVTVYFMYLTSYLHVSYIIIYTLRIETDRAEETV